jgi:endonuclease YncB( thermonuclease family)
LTVSVPVRSLLWFSITKQVRAAVLCAAAVLGLPAQALTLMGQVVRVADGDTVTVLDQAQQTYKVRLAGIDAPEKKQAFGQRSRQSLYDMVHGKNVKLETHKRDKYGRHVGTLKVDNVDVNLTQVQRGMAWHYTAYAREQAEQDQQSYSAAERQAREAKLGLWADNSALAPWAWRQGER